MAVDEAARHRLYERPEQVLGAEHRDAADSAPGAIVEQLAGDSGDVARRARRELEVSGDRREIHALAPDRFGLPEDIVYAALYLASDESSWTTGTEFVVDGGITVNYF